MRTMSLEDENHIGRRELDVERGRGLSSLLPLERNPLLYPPHFESPTAMDGFRWVVEKMIEEKGGLPVVIETLLVQDYGGNFFPRLVARFNPKHISQEQLEALQEVARRMYPVRVRGLKNSDGSTSAKVRYPKMEGKGSKDTTAVGYYFGLEWGKPNQLTTGLFVFRKINRKDVANGVSARRDTAWFTQGVLQDNSGNDVSSKYLVEIREAGLYQTDLAEAIVLTSLVLAGKELPAEKPGLVEEIYHYMNRIGLKEEVQIGGLEPQAAEIEEALFTPLANPELMNSLSVRARAILIVGQTGTGKTQLIRHFLSRDMRVFMINVNTNEFETDLMLADEDKVILPRIRQVTERIGRNVVLILEDAEHLAMEDNPTSSTFLNQLAGLFKNGYCVICTTNRPELFNSQLLEVERLGGRKIFCPLPNEVVRRSILEVHMPLTYGRSEIDLFDPTVLGQDIGVCFESSQQARTFILEALAKSTQGLTHRYLEDICARAKSSLIARVKEETGRGDNLGEADLRGRPYRLDDWLKAFKSVLEGYDLETRLKEDERLRKFVFPGRSSLKGEFGSFDGRGGESDLYKKLQKRLNGAA